MLHTIKNNKIKRILLGLVIVIPLLAFSLHKEYYSLTKIDYNKNEKAIQITMRLFTNDLELALHKQHDKPIELGTELEMTEADKYIELYLNQRFQISINTKKSPYLFLGKEFEKDAVYLYMEIINVETINQIAIKNSILTEQFYEQENIIKVTIGDIRKSLILTKENDKGMLNF